MSLLTSPSSNRNPNQVGKVAELDFVTAPHNIPEEEEQYGWWFSKVPFLLRGKIYSLATRRTKVLMHMTMWSASLVFSRGKNIEPVVQVMIPLLLALTLL